MQPEEIRKLGETLSAPFIEQQKILKSIFAPLTNPITEIQRVMKEAFKPFEELSELVKYHIYVDPVTFKALAEIFPVPPANYNKETNSDDSKYYIYTNGVKSPEYDGLQVTVNKETALLISTLDRGFKHKFYASITKVPFDKRKSLLIIEEKQFVIMKGTEVFSLCVMLFGSKQYIEKIWQWKDIEERVLDLAKERASDEGALKSKIFRLNRRIMDKLGYKEVIMFRDKTVRVNPEFIYLFK